MKVLIPPRPDKNAFCFTCYLRGRVVFNCVECRGEGNIDEENMP